MRKSKRKLAEFALCGVCIQVRPRLLTCHWILRFGRESVEVTINLEGNFMAENEKDIGKRLILFAATIIRLLEDVKTSKPAKHIADQLLRSSTSVGANYEEARAAESRADFIHKMQVSLKEMREAYYWLCLIVEASLVNTDESECLCDEARQLRAILSKAVVTAKANQKS